MSAVGLQPVSAVVEKHLFLQYSLSRDVLRLRLSLERIGSLLNSTVGALLKHWQLSGQWLSVRSRIDAISIEHGGWSIVLLRYRHGLRYVVLLEELYKVRVPAEAHLLDLNIKPTSDEGSCWWIVCYDHRKR